MWRHPVEHLGVLGEDMERSENGSSDIGSLSGLGIVKEEIDWGKGRSLPSQKSSSAVSMVAGSLRRNSNKGPVWSRPGSDKSGGLLIKTVDILESGLDAYLYERVYLKLERTCE